MSKIFKNIWKIICYPLLYMWIQIVVSFVYMFIPAFNVVFTAIMSGDEYNADVLTNQILSGVNLSIIIIISDIATFLIIYLLLKKEWKEEKLWKFDKTKISPLPICIVLGITLNLSFDLIINLLPKSISEYPQPFDDIIGNNFILDLFSIVIFAALLEEIIFRGIVLKNLTKMMKIPAAVIIQALIFGIIHLNLLQSSYAFVLGLILGLAYVWFDSIWVSITIHGAFNATSVVLMYVLGEKEINEIYWMIISAIALITSVLCMVVLSRERIRKEKIYEL